MKTRTILYMAILAVVLLACKPKEYIAGHYNYDTECLGKNLDGSQLVKTWGTGMDVKEARENAFKEALRDVMFKGIRNGSDECKVSPMITDVNAMERHEDYFNGFFSDRGDYRDFIEEQNKKSFKNEDSNKKQAYGFIVLIDMQGLKSHLQQDQIL